METRRIRFNSSYARGKEIFQVVKPTQIYRWSSATHRHVRSTRQTPTPRQPFTANVTLLSLRARYYDTSTGEFCSQDPLEYVDGMSLYLGYFVMVQRDPSGMLLLDDIDVRSFKPSLKFCGKKTGTGWKFTLPNRHETSGWLVQKVTVTCQRGKADCFTLTTTCDYPDGEELESCSLLEPEQFTYYEAWRVPYDSRVPVNPGNRRGVLSDKAEYVAKRGSCAEIRQHGELRYYPDGTEGIAEVATWGTRDLFGADTRCPTTQYDLQGISGKTKGGKTYVPPFWKNEVPMFKGSRDVVFSWFCCKDRDKDRVNVVPAPVPKKVN